MSDLKTYINASVGSGSVTSVAMTVPTGLTISGSPITTSGTLGLSLASGYSLLTSAQATSISNIPTATSQLTNDSGFITSQYTQPTSLGAVGTYAWCARTATGEFDYITQGATYSGSSLVFSGVARSSGNNILPGSGSIPSGTWRAMGVIGSAFPGFNTRMTLFLRIS